jgi:hypothetical protein
MQVFATLVCLGNTADMGPGCETCPSPAWDAWKKEPPVLPKPTRPPAMTLPADAAEKQHILDLMQVKDAPRYDSVMSTEGDLGTHPASTNKDASGRRICDIMHPRLTARAKEWAEQCVLFDPAASYPMFIMTLTKTRDSPMGVQQLAHAGCDAARIKSLGFTASQFKDAGFDVQPLKAQSIFTLHELVCANYDVPSLIAGGYSVAELKSAGVTASQLKTHGCSAQQLLQSFSSLEIQAAGFDVAELYSFVLDDSAHADVLAAAQAFYSDVEFASQLCSEFAAAESGDPAMASLFSEAHSKLQLIVVHNVHLKSPLSERQPAWPRHEALMRFDLPLQCLDSGSSATKESKEWFARFYLLRGSRLYYCDGKNGHPDTQDGTLAFMLSKPAPDGRYCVDLQGMLTRAPTCRDIV